MYGSSFLWLCHKLGELGFDIGDSMFCLLQVPALSLVKPQPFTEMTDPPVQL